MSKVMETTSLSRLLSRIAGEHRAKASIYDIPEAAYRAVLELEAGSPGLEVVGGRASLPVGPAAGPHSQIAPNLVAAYLAGARVFELKTVQENDSLDIEKPCIWALDEGHNTEWSTELSLEAAREEYLRGWIAVNLLAAMLSPSPRSFVFNASVGYTLEGIRGPKMDAFIEGLRRPSAPENGGFWKGAMRDLEAFVRSGELASSFGAEAQARARGLLAGFPDAPVSSVTLSTMHGCPPDEIERIASYLIEEKGLDVFVKLNPTLLGYDEVRRILDRTGWTGIELDRGLFERDLKMPDALSLIASLAAKAEARGRSFGLKLSNTLANANAGGFLPGAERYMSGRALFPVTARLAASLAAALPRWRGRFSYCGGAGELNAGQLIAAGLGPVTIATDILKPGGYLRLAGAARAAAEALPGSASRPDAAALGRLADAALARPEYRADWKSGNASIKKSLPLFDCFAAPCVEACPVGQKVPEYIRLGAAGRTAEAFEAIIADNPLPCTTGTLCDHVCQEACSRNDYEGPVAIRAAKLACATAAAAAGPRRPARPRATLAAGKSAVIGAGPAGLSCAYSLALSGVPVTVFDEAREAGGVPANVIPRFRIAREELGADIDRIRALGAEFRLGVRVDSLDRLEAEGYSSVFVAAGAPSPRSLALSGEGLGCVDAIAFLEACSRIGSEAAGEAAHPFPDARRIIVAGGGNTAMDAARVALRLPGVESVSISYRRTRGEMPADREELENALAEGASLLELTLPERASPASGGEGPWLSLRIMALGESDASGRRAPVATDRSSAVECDLLVAALGETPDRGLFERLGLPLDEDGRPVFDPATMRTPRAGTYVGGDAARGPSSIIAAAADGRRAARAILAAAGVAPEDRPYSPPEPDPRKLAARGLRVESLHPEATLFLEREASRCLECDSACLRCVEVCPNRANTAIRAGAGFAQSLQILHVDYLCNECGNCGLFCPYEGEPYRGKATLFAEREALEKSHNAGFAFVAVGAAGGPSGGPDEARLIYREAVGGPIAEAGPGWASTSGAAPLVELARIVARDHAYLMGGGR